MKLRTQILLAAAATIVLCLGVSEVLSYRQVADFFTRHEMRLQQGGEREAMLAALRQDEQSLLWQSAALRLLGGLGVVVTLWVAVHLLWTRLISRPIDVLRERMNSMSRGTWTQPMPVEQQDEISSLVGEFNLLGPRLIYAAHQYAAASKLAAMALIGQRVTRRTGVARSHLAEIQQVLAEARYQSQVVPQSAVRQLGEVADELADLAAELESGFNDELVRQGLPTGLMCRENDPRIAGQPEAPRRATENGKLRIRST